MKTLLTTTAIILAMSTAAMANGNANANACNTGEASFCEGEQDETVTTGPKGDKGDRGNDGTNGANGTNGTNGADGADGSNGTNGVDGLNGANALGSLSFAAASSSFYGDGMGFGLSNSNYGDLEGSVVFGFDIDADWRVIAGITTDFKGNTAGSIGVGVSF